MLSCKVCLGQGTPERPTVKERLPDGSVIIELNGVSLRSFPVEKIRALLGDKIRREELETENANLKETIKYREAQVASLQISLEAKAEVADIAQAQAQTLRESNAQALNLISRVETLCTPKKSKLMVFLEHPVSVLLLRTALPIALPIALGAAR